VSEENVELVRQGFQALREGGVEALLPFIHPEFSVTTPAELTAEPDTYRGHEGVRRYFDSFYDAMDWIDFEPGDFIAVGDAVVVPMTVRARGRTTGIETEQRVVQVWELEDDKAIRVQVFAELDEALTVAREALSGDESPDAGSRPQRL
jgi:ketosteroid isomerase-like protein